MQKNFQIDKEGESSSFMFNHRKYIKGLIKDLIVKVKYICNHFNAKSKKI